MTEFEIHIPARKKAVVSERDMAVKVTGEAYNALIDMITESTLSMQDVASRAILFASEHVEYGREE